jgi:hypothetical protein
MLIVTIHTSYLFSHEYNSIDTLLSDLKMKLSIGKYMPLHRTKAHQVQQTTRNAPGVFAKYNKKMIEIFFRLQRHHGKLSASSHHRFS